MRAEPQTHLSVDLSHRIGTLNLRAAFETSATWTVLFGPSGSGKSTILRAVAGLIEPDHGRIAVLGRPVVDTGTGLFVVPHLRPTRWAGQRAALFPQKSVLRNLAAVITAESGSVHDGLLEEAIEHFGLRPLAEKRPDQLSGGERQRVSVIRAAVTARDRLLLLDEPFAGLDAGLRDQLIGQLVAWLRGAPVLSVTHDVGEAFLLNAEVIRLAEGRVVAQGPAATVLDQDRVRLRTALDR